MGAVDVDCQSGEVPLVGMAALEPTVYCVWEEEEEEKEGRPAGGRAASLVVLTGFPLASRALASLTDT